MTAQDKHQELLRLSAEIVISHASNNSVALAELPQLIERVYASLEQAGAPAAPVASKPQPAVSVRASVKRDHLVCLEDGKKLKTLRKHLRTDHGMTPEGYRAKWNLPSSYPMVAPDYAARRSAMAKDMGLGTKPGARKKKGRRTLGIVVPGAME